MCNYNQSAKSAFYPNLEEPTPSPTPLRSSSSLGTAYGSYLFGIISANLSLILSAFLNNK
jgi:hypothetical protein